MRRHNFTEGQLQDIKFRYQNGESFLSIAKSFDVTPKVIINRLKKMNIDMSLKGNRKYYYDDNIFKELDTPEKAYWFGFIMSDGYIIEERNSLRLKLGAQDEGHILKFLDFLGCPHELLMYETHNITGNVMPKIEISNKILVPDLIRHGFVGKKEDRIKPILSSDELRRNLVRGMMDADGCISKKINSSYEINLTSASLAYCKIVEKVFNSVCTRPVNIRKHGDGAYRVDTSRRTSVKRILEYLYQEDDVSLERKYNLALNAIAALESDL